MSIIQQIREKYAAIGIGFIALSLIGFILMDSVKGGGGGLDPNEAIGEVHGKKFSFSEYSSKVNSLEEMQQMSGRPIDDFMRQQIQDEIWRQLVDNQVLEQEYTKLGILVSKKEFNDLLFGANPPDFLLQQFTNPETGAYDAAAAKQAIAELKKGKNPNTKVIEEYYLKPLVEQTKRDKYNALLQNSAFAPKWLAEKTMADNSAIANFQYVSVPYSSVPDSAVTVTDQMIEKYVSARKREFKQEFNLRSIAYVAFPFTPSASDSSEALTDLLSLRDEFSTTDDVESFLIRNSTTIPLSKNYFSKERIQIEQKDSIINAGVGVVYGPYNDGGSFVMSRVLDVKTLPDSVKARHILISVNDPRTQQPILSDSVAKARIDSIEAAIKGGASFDALARTYSDDPGSKEKGGDLGFFASGMMVPEFNDFCFEKSKGSLGVVKTQFGYHLIQVMDQKNFVPAYKIAYMGKSIDASMQTVNDALNAANQFAGNTKTAKQFDDNVIKQGLNKLIIPDIRESENNLMGLGTNRRFVKDIFEASVGKVLEPAEFNDQYVVAVVTSAEKKGVMSAAKARPMVESILRNELKRNEIVKKLGTFSTLQDIANKQNVAVLTADSISFVSPVLPGSGFEPKVGGFAFAKSNMNKVSAPVGGNSGVFVLQTSFVGAGQNMGSAEDIQNQLRNQSKNSAFGGSLNALKEKADIKDYRSKFY